MEVKPDRAVSVVETDISVDFAPPKDYKEPDYRAQAAAAAAAQPAAAAPEPAGGAAAPGTEAAEPEPPSFTAFTGMPSLLRYVLLRLLHCAIGSATCWVKCSASDVSHASLSGQEPW